MSTDQLGALTTTQSQSRSCFQLQGLADTQIAALAHTVLTAHGAGAGHPLGDPGGGLHPAPDLRPTAQVRGLTSTSIRRADARADRVAVDQPARGVDHGPVKGFS